MLNVLCRHISNSERWTFIAGTAPHRPGPVFAASAVYFHGCTYYFDILLGHDRSTVKVRREKGRRGDKKL